MSSVTATTAVQRDAFRIAAARPVSWFEIVLLLICVACWSPPACRRACRTSCCSRFLFAGLALAWNIAGGYAGLISFGHAAFFGIGAYTSTILLLHYDVTPWIGIWRRRADRCASLGAVLALICARLRGPFFILSTLAFAEVVRIGALNWSSLTGGPEGLSILPMPDLANMVFASKTAYAALMLGYLVAGLRDHQGARGLAVRLLSVCHARQ